MNATLKTHTLGCKVNQYETEFVRQGLKRAGFRDAAASEPADVCVVNTCTVTAEGDTKSRQIIRRMARQNPDARIVVMGCYATRAPEEVQALPGVTDVITDKRELPDLLSRFGVVDVPTGLSGHSGRHRAYVKVQDGCLLRCSYCIIPHVRPELTSRPMVHIVEEVQRLVAAGFREVVLTGIHLGHYGVDWNRDQPKEKWIRLAHLVQKIAELPGEFRIRISSIEATEVTRELIDILKAYPKRIAPHLHVCLQSGSDPILRAMRRRWSTKMFIDRCNMLRDALDKPALTTDVIVGFPGETEAHFGQTLQTCREAGFSKIHAFPFSPRRGTPAATMSDQVDKPTKSDRLGRLMDLEADLRQQYYNSLVGHQLEVLVEGSRPLVQLASGNSGFAHRGTSSRYVSVEFHSDNDNLESQLVPVQAISAMEDRILGQ